MGGYGESLLRKGSSQVVVAYRNRLPNLGRKPTKGTPGSTHRKVLGYLQEKYKMRKTGAKNTNPFARIWKSTSSKVSEDSGMELMKSVHKK